MVRFVRSRILGSLIAAVVFLCALPAAVAAAAPPNDNFGNAFHLNGSVVWNVPVAGATVEPGEPAHAGRGPFNSLWWKYQPAKNGRLSIDTHGSSGNTVLAVYTGSAVNSLAGVAANDDDGSPLQNSGLFNIPILGGILYKIAVASYAQNYGYGYGYGYGYKVNWTFKASNSAPVFTKGQNQTVLEDSGVKTVTPWATGIGPGAPEDAGQVLNFIVTNNNNLLFSVQPAVSPSGTLTFTPKPDANGSATVTVVLHDNGGTAYNGSDTSAPQTFTITVTAVNDPPTLNTIAARTINEDDGLQTVGLSGISAGGGETQSLAVTATSSNPGLIPNPTVTYTSPSATGSLAFAPVANMSGVATITVTVSDGQPANNTVVRTFLVTVKPPSYVLWAKRSTGQAVRWKVDPATGTFRKWQWIASATGVRSGWQATSYVRGATADYVLWTNSSTGQATRWSVNSANPAVIIGWKWIGPATGFGSGWQASSYARGDASADYVLWTNRNNGKAVRHKVDPVTGVVKESIWLSAPTGIGAGWEATGYERGNATTDYVLWANYTTGKSVRWKIDPGTGALKESIWIARGSVVGWQASSYARGNATTDYVLWTNGTTGKSVRWQVDPVTGLMKQQVWISPSAGSGLGWISSSYLASETIGAPVAAPADEAGGISVVKAGSGTGTIVAGVDSCGPECDTLLLPGADLLGSVEAIPEVGSRFAGWETVTGQAIDILAVQPGESVLAVFEEE